MTLYCCHWPRDLPEHYLQPLILLTDPFALALQKQWWGGTTTFQSPLVSYVYERGWRQGFSWAGFPGADIEFDLAMGYLKPAFGEVLIDMSCGSGLFTRKFAKSGKVMMMMMMMMMMMTR